MLLKKFNYNNFSQNEVAKIENFNFGCGLISNKYGSIFHNVPDNIVICINKDNILNIFSQIKNKNCYIEDSTDDRNLNRKKISEEINQSTNNCSDDIIYKYESNGKCYSNCPNVFLMIIIFLNANVN